MMNPFQENWPKPVPKKRLMEEEEEAEREAELEKEEELRRKTTESVLEGKQQQKMSPSDVQELLKNSELSKKEFGMAKTVLLQAKELLLDIDDTLERINASYEKEEASDLVDNVLRTLIRLCPEQQKEVEMRTGKGAYRTSEKIVLESSGPKARLKEMQLKRAASVKPRRISPKLRVLQGWKGRLLATLMLVGSGAANTAALQHMIDTGVDHDVDAFLGLPGGRGHE